MSDYCTTPEERHEVAERLRHLTPSKQVHPDYTPWYTDICKAVGGKKDPWFGILALAERLADLIDPTCELDLDFCMEYIVCQSCGYELPHGTHLDETKYCPNCGSRVVVSKDD